MKKNILLTGCVGFIGYHLSLKMLKNGHYVFGIDSLNNYYDVKIKNKRLAELKKYQKFKFFKLDLVEKNKLNKIFINNKISLIVNLAAQAGVRYSQISREPYVKSNLIGFFNLLEMCKIFKIKSCYFASTSSVYGENKNFPLKEEYIPTPVSFYAATKICNEILAQSYSQMTNTKFIGLRFLPKRFL